MNGTKINSIARPHQAPIDPRTTPIAIRRHNAADPITRTLAIEEVKYAEGANHVDHFGRIRPCLGRPDARVIEKVCKPMILLDAILLELLNGIWSCPSNNLKPA